MNIKTRITTKMTLFAHKQLTLIYAKISFLTETTKFHKNT